MHGCIRMLFVWSIIKERKRKFLEKKEKSPGIDLFDQFVSLAAREIGGYTIRFVVSGNGLCVFKMC